MRVTLYLPSNGAPVVAVDACNIPPSDALNMVRRSREMHHVPGARLELWTDDGGYISTEVCTPNGWIRSV